MNILKINRKMSALTWLFVAITSCYVLQNLFSVWFSSNIFLKKISLSATNVNGLNLLSLLTYSFINEGLMSLFLNSIALWLLGTTIERQFGSKRLLIVFFTASLVGGLTWLCLHWNDHGSLTGSIIACLGLLSYFCACNADKQAIFFFLFVFPMSLKPKHLLTAVLVIEIIGMFFGEIFLHKPIIASANIGGIIGGLLCYRWFNGKAKVTQPVENPLVNVIKKQPKAIDPMQSDNYNVYITSQSAQKTEIDRILDKINESGFGSLSKEERNTLNSAKQVMHR